MNGNSGLPTLTDAKGLGGVIAQEGFDYQLWDGLARLPAWLANPSFEQMIFEGLEDLEARFFAPHAPAGHLLERYQAKSAVLAPGEVAEVFKSFQTFETSFPQVARVQTLVTPQLPKTVSWLGRDPSRVRRARPFYAPFSGIAAASDEKLKDDLIATYGEKLGTFVFDAVEVNERNLPDRDSGLQAFGVALGRSFPSLDISSRRIEQAFEALSSLARRNVGIPLLRGVLIKTIDEALGQRLPLPEAYPLLVRSDRNEQDETALEIDACAFSRGAAPYPDVHEWRSDLLLPLDRTARWLRQRGVSRVALSGSYRLTTALCLGWSLRSAIGFELEIPTREGSWRTDDRPAPGTAMPTWRSVEPAGFEGGDLVVSVGVLRDPSIDLAATANVAPGAVVALSLAEPITSAAAAQASVSFVKRTVDAAVARFRPATIRLYLAGPAAFAVALGHRWNGMPVTQLHEFDAAARCYEPTARLEAL
ncbi:SAVED domain-containing protein [Neorhizobium sp. DT-125]|uniref:SAVED domain-containing protein n=1 Tax=Neorhizobium sp. DT-125 TaxID=3396163 RepID=UPI003F1CB55E